VTINHREVGNNDILIAPKPIFLQYFDSSRLIANELLELEILN